MKGTYKIGQQIEFKEDYSVKTFNGRNIEVKKGDKAIVNSRGFIEYTSGKAKGIRQIVDGITVEGYDHMNISKQILNRLLSEYDLQEFMDYEEISIKGFLEEIEDVLCEIL